MNGKDFDGWNEAKKRLHQRDNRIYARPRDIWWCALGINVGFEIDGKHENFERPVLVLRVYNRDTLLVLPMTGRIKQDQYHYQIVAGLKKTWISLTQIRVISNRRLLRKIGVVTDEELDSVKRALIQFL